MGSPEWPPYYYKNVLQRSGAEEAMTHSGNRKNRSEDSLTGLRKTLGKHQVISLLWQTPVGHG